MYGESNIQRYSRYRDSQHHVPLRATTSIDQYLPTTSYLQYAKQNENDYSRYRSSSSRRQSSLTRSDNRLKIHYKARTLKYDDVAQRFPVPDNKVCWNNDFPDYKPVEYTTKKILSNPKADSTDLSKINFNQLDHKIDRRSFTGIYYIDPITQRPRNPIGRTGMTGRGRLYYWGPNHAGDPVVTRWKRDEDRVVIRRQIDGTNRVKPVLEFVAIQRRDTKQWAIPGGMVDPGESISETVKREFHEEALRNGVDEDTIKRLFSNGFKLYQSYADDPRNTDNAWMETVAIHFHDETGVLTHNLNLGAGDDAEKVVWCTIDRTLDLYASHKEFLKLTVDRLDAYW